MPGPVISNRAEYVEAMPPTMPTIIISMFSTLECRGTNLNKRRESDVKLSNGNINANVTRLDIKWYPEFRKCLMSNSVTDLGLFLVGGKFQVQMSEI